MTVSVEDPEVRFNVPGATVVVANLAVPALDHVHDMRYQKLFCGQSAPPVAKSKRSHCCARLFSKVMAWHSAWRYAIGDGREESDWQEEVTPKNESSTKASPMSELEILWSAEVN